MKYILAYTACHSKVQFWALLRPGPDAPASAASPMALCKPLDMHSTRDRFIIVRMALLSAAIVHRLSSLLPRILPSTDLACGLPDRSRVVIRVGALKSTVRKYINEENQPQLANENRLHMLLELYKHLKRSPCRHIVFPLDFRRLRGTTIENPHTYVTFVPVGAFGDLVHALRTFWLESG